MTRREVGEDIVSSVEGEKKSHAVVAVKDIDAYIQKGCVEEW